MQATFVVIEGKFRTDEGFIKDDPFAGKKGFVEAKLNEGGHVVSSQAKRSSTSTVKRKGKKKKEILVDIKKYWREGLRTNATLRSLERWTVKHRRAKNRVHGVRHLASHLARDVEAEFTMWFQMEEEGEGNRAKQWVSSMGRVSRSGLGLNIKSGLGSVTWATGENKILTRQAQSQLSLDGLPIGLNMRSRPNEGTRTLSSQGSLLRGTTAAATAQELPASNTGRPPPTKWIKIRLVFFLSRSHRPRKALWPNSLYQLLQRRSPLRRDSTMFVEHCHRKGGGETGIPKFIGSRTCTEHTTGRPPPAMTAQRTTAKGSEEDRRRNSELGLSAASHLYPANSFSSPSAALGFGLGKTLGPYSAPSFSTASDAPGFGLDKTHVAKSYFRPIFDWSRVFFFIRPKSFF